MRSGLRLTLLKPAALPVTPLTVIMGDLMGGLLVGRLASGGLGAGQIAWLTTRRILISLCCFSFFSFLMGLWLV